MEQTRWRKGKEGFDIFTDDYYIEVQRNIKSTSMGGLQPYIDKIKEYLSTIPNPVDIFDETFATLIQAMILMMIGNPDCKGEKGTMFSARPKNKFGGAVSTFTWASGKSNAFKEMIKEGFSANNDYEVMTTIKSFMKNHPKIKNETALLTFYFDELNKYQKSIALRLTPDEVFVFNNEFDNRLSDPEVLLKLSKMPILSSPSVYTNDAAGFTAYLKKDARFVFTSKKSFEFFPFHPEYTSAPTDTAEFINQLKKVNDPDFMTKLNDFLYNLIPAAAPPTPPSTNDLIDPKYVYSINLNATEKDTIQNYLTYVTVYLSLLAYTNSEYNDIIFPMIETQLCHTYMLYLNAIDFQKFCNYSTYLTTYEVALFNHLFFCCIQQDQTVSNIYNLSTDISVSLLTVTPNLYINLKPQSIYGMIPMFVSQINTRLPYLSSDSSNSQPLPLTTSLVLPATGDSSVPILLVDYILGMDAATSSGTLDIFGSLSGLTDSISGLTDSSSGLTDSSNFDTTSTSSPEATPTATPTTTPPPSLLIPVDPAITKTFIPSAFLQCQKGIENIHDECMGYAKTIKQELYRLFMVPIVLFLVYNFYYLFFFKDCFSPAKVTDEKGTIHYKAMCEGGEKGGCFHPIFPDWEAMFHDIEGHNTDFFFEFIFKPAKLIYTFLNAIKALFRKIIPGYILKDEWPYMFFLMTFSYVIGFVETNGAAFLSVLYRLINMEVPDFDFIGTMTLSDYTKTVVYISFFFSFVKKVITGKDPREMIANAIEKKMKERQEAAAEAMQGGGDDDEEGGNKEEGESCDTDPRKSTWLCWINNATQIGGKVVNAIIFILYWVFKIVILSGMMTFTMFITLIYFFYICIFGTVSFTTVQQSSSDKIDLINRVMYTKLCNNTNDGQITYLFKSIVFFIIYFLAESYILYTLYQSMQNFTYMDTPSNAINSSINVGVKSALFIVYGILLTIVLLWCAYKFHVKMPSVVHNYKSSAEGDDTVDKRFEYKCAESDAYETETKNSFISIFTNSDAFNKTFNDQWNQKTAGLISENSFAGMVAKANEYKYRMETSAREAVEKATKWKDNVKDGLKARYDAVKNGVSAVKSAVGLQS